MIPQLLVIDVRGRELKVENNKRKVMVNLPESMELMNWFLGELWQDLHPAAIADAPVAPGAAGGPADPATDSEKDDEADNREAFDKKVGEAVAKVVGELRAHGAIRAVFYDKKNARLRIQPKYMGAAAK